MTLTRQWFSVLLAALLGVALSGTAALALPDYAKLPAAYAGLPHKLTNKLGMKFVLIPPGSFMMGSPDGEVGHQQREHLHKVTLTKPFYMQTTEVTLGQWHRVMGRSWLTGGRPGGPNSPVVQVSWFDTRDFIRKLNRMGQGTYRLPTEAEWEYTARAGTTTPYPWGEGINCDRAMYENNSLKHYQCQKYYLKRGLPADSPAPVGSFPPNSWGLYDMQGNVWEWVADWLGPYPKHAVSDPKGPANGEWRVRRGGSWFGGYLVLRSANRNFAHPGSKYNTLGFRLVREVK